jgi:hypothetical protein
VSIPILADFFQIRVEKFGNNHKGSLIIWKITGVGKFGNFQIILAIF